jgi:hypothetical protein
MKIRTILSYLIIATFLLALVPVVQAEDEQTSTVIYQTTFSTDPRWTTNNPSTDYWDSNIGMYHFSIEPSTGSYAYIPVQYNGGSFKLEYDLILNRLDDGATFRLGFSGVEMDSTNGPNVLTQFTNAKYGKIMWLRLITQGKKMVEVNSQKGDTQSSGSMAYTGPTVKYEINKTYHVTVNYDDPNRLLSMKVNEKASAKDIWSYYVNTGEDLTGMKRIYVGSKGDYGMMGIYAQGYIDNVRLTAPAAVTEAPTNVITVEETAAAVTQPTAKTTTRKPVTTAPAAAETTKSPSSAFLPVAALGIVGICIGLFAIRRRE